MTIRAVLFDIGGVLELTPPTGWAQRWEAELGLAAGELEERLSDVYRAGSVGAISEGEAKRRMGALLGLDRTRLDVLIADQWEEYLGTLNVELADYFGSLRPRYRTGILSNSFVGAREKEQARYRFGDLCDVIVYSHEEGLEKPDPRFFALACARLEVEAQEVVFLDDVEGHVAAARELGMQSVLFTETKKAIADIETIFAARSCPLGGPGRAP